MHRQAFEQPVVAVLGASGIGKHHAKWWALEGARVNAILGTSESSLAAAAARLGEMFGFSGRCYTDLEALLAAEKPDIVDVSTPPACHHRHVKTALMAGCHVLCEKPFVYHPHTPRETLVKQARELVDMAADRDLMLAISTQYAIAGEECLKLWRQHRPRDRITTCHGRLASPYRHGENLPAGVWIDLAPHMLAAAHAIVGSACIDWTTLDTRFSGECAAASFRCVTAEHGRVDAAVTTFRTHGEPRNLRELEINGDGFHIEGRNDENGVFRAVLETPWGTVRKPDMMHLLIRSFMQGDARVAGSAAVTHLDAMLRMLDQGTSEP